MNAEIVRYLDAVRRGQPWNGPPPDLMGRILRGRSKDPTAFTRLVDRDDRFFTMLFDGDGLALLPGLSGERMLCDVTCYERAFLAQLLEEEYIFKLLVMRRQPSALRGTWPNLFTMLRICYPKAYRLIEPHQEALQTRSFEEIEAEAGFLFLNRKITLAEFEALTPAQATLAMARLFLYRVTGQTRYFKGEGFTYDGSGRSIAPEHFFRDQLITREALGEFDIIPIDVRLT